jgi:hypothetical protein
MDFVICVKYEEQIGLSECAVKSQRPIVCEIDPLVGEEFAINSLFFEKLGNNVLSAVSGAGVADNPVIKTDFITQHLQCSSDNMRFVLDYHV